MAINPTALRALQSVMGRRGVGQTRGIDYGAEGDYSGNKGYEGSMGVETSDPTEPSAPSKDQFELWSGGFWGGKPSDYSISVGGKTFSAGEVAAGLVGAAVAAVTGNPVAGATVAAGLATVGDTVLDGVYDVVGYVSDTLSGLGISITPEKATEAIKQQQKEFESDNEGFVQDNAQYFSVLDGSSTTTGDNKSWQYNPWQQVGDPSDYSSNYDYVLAQGRGGPWDIVGQGLWTQWGLNNAANSYIKDMTDLGQRYDALFGNSAAWNQAFQDQYNAQNAKNEALWGGWNKKFQDVTDQAEADYSAIQSYVTGNKMPISSRYGSFMASPIASTNAMTDVANSKYAALNSLLGSQASGYSAAADSFNANMGDQVSTFSDLVNSMGLQNLGAQGQISSGKYDAATSALKDIYSLGAGNLMELLKMEMNSNYAGGGNSSGGDDSNSALAWAMALGALSDSYGS